MAECVYQIFCVSIPLIHVLVLKCMRKHSQLVLLRFAHELLLVILRLSRQLLVMSFLFASPTS